MSDLIFHHYPGSPFSEKVRLIFGLKRLPWRSVHIPVILPKPDVVALTGGYRKTPLLQIGADVYCDTSLISRVIERIAPEPTLYPREVAGAAQILAHWADTTLFWAVVPYVMQPQAFPFIFKGVPAEVIQAFGTDRAAFTAGMRRQTPVDAKAQLHSYLAWLESQLSDGREWLTGGAPSIADFSVGHCMWYVRRASNMAVILEGFPRLSSLADRVLAIGHGTSEPMSSAQAIEIAAKSTPRPCEVRPGMGFEAGQSVTVCANDYGTDPVEGVLVGLSDDEVAITRTDARAGTLVVHFPRIGFQIKAAKPQA
jgi:glutathione S-transferase